MKDSEIRPESKLPCQELEEQLLHWWHQRYGRPLTTQQKLQIDHWVKQAHLRLQQYGSLEDCLGARGVSWELSQQNHRVAGVRFRARLDLKHKRLVIFAGALEELARPHRSRRLVERVILSHEVFHLLCPECPGRLQEAAAHGFAAQAQQLKDFPGLWDFEVE